ncbi:MAG: flagellar motor protein MotB [Verrucomicrobiae bacterium]|nr:flagellar motor protein MotB [Verrucomicrobiae bacterium]
MAGKGGGAWKVAYADFVTAMMALFLVLWITSQDKKIKEAIELTFKHPFLRGPRQSSGIIPNTVESVRGKSLAGQYDKPSMVEVTMLQRLNEDIVRMLGTNPDYARNQSVLLEFTEKGLNISVLNRTHKPIFEPDTARLTEYGRWVFSTIAWEIARYKHLAVEVEGHCPQRSRETEGVADKWDLTASRANVARRHIVANGVAPEQILKVAGYADTKPLRDVSPTDERNSRVTMILSVREDQVLAHPRS